MKSLLKYVYTFGFVAILLSLTACSGQPNFDVNLENGSEIAIETDHLRLTNQDVFELVAGGYMGWGNPGIAVILEWADAIILADIEIDEERLESDRAFFEEFFDEEQIESFLIAEGFDTMDDYFAAVRVDLLREAAVEARLSELVTSEAIDAEYERMFASDDETDEDEEEENEDALTTEEIRDLIEEVLREEISNTPGFEQQVLAALRAEANFTIHSSYFAAQYENLLAVWAIDDIDIVTGSNSDVVAEVDNQTFSADELFSIVVARFALNDQSPLLNHINLDVLSNIYNVSRNTIREDINQAKVNLMDWFYPQMEAQGLMTEQQIFEAFTFWHLQDLAFNEAFADISEDRLQALYDIHVENLITTFELENTPERSVRHILIQEIPADDENGDEPRTHEEAYAFAQELIAQLQAAPAGEFEDLFIDLAQTYSACPSGERGGDLGSFGPGAMVSEFEEATFALDLYGFTQTPIETIHGFHIIYLYEIEDLDIADAPDIPTFEAIRSQLVEDELHRLRSNPIYFNQLLKGFRADQNITFHLPQLHIQYEAQMELLSGQMDE